MKFRVKDEDGNNYIVEEDELENVDTVKDEDEASTASAEPEAQAPALTDEEIAALKELAKIAPKLMELANDDEEVMDSDDDENIDNDMNEQVIDTDEEIEEDEEKMTTDSVKSFGAIQKNTMTTDSELADDVSSAWQKRLNGGLK